MVAVLVVVAVFVDAVMDPNITDVKTKEWHRLCCVRITVVRGLEVSRCGIKPRLQHSRGNLHSDDSFGVASRRYWGSYPQTALVNVDAHPEELRGKLVDSEGKKRLEVENRGNLSSNWKRIKSL